MSNFWENPFFSILTLLFFAGGLALLLFIPQGHEVLMLNELRYEPLNGFFRFCTHLGEDWGYYAAALVAVFVRYRFVAIIALTGLMVMPVSYVLKDKIAHDRPITWLEKQGLRGEISLVPHVELATGQTSFPSGHTMSAFALFSVLTAMLSRRWQWLGGLLAYSAVLVAASRVFLVQHFLADVLGGAAVGLALGWAICRAAAAGFPGKSSFWEKKLGLR